jgi:hypothetical protein
VTNLDKLADILERLERVETALAGIGHNDGPPIDDRPVAPDPEREAQDRRLSAVMVANRYGVVVRTIDRWLESPELNFPKPDPVNGRRYWWLSCLRNWDRTRAERKKGGP